MNTPKKYSFIAAGEILIDFMSREPAKPLSTSSTFGKFFGGAPANVAVNMKRLGVESTIVSKVGNDGLGSFLLDYLDQLGLDSSYISRDPHFPTSMVVLTSGTTTAEFVAYRQADTRLTREEIPDGLILDGDIFHTTAHGIARRPTRDAVLDAFVFAHRNKKITSFDPNYCVKYWPDRDDAIETIRKFLAVTTFCKPSLDDCERIFGKQPEEKYLQFFHDMGAQYVLFTRGEKGAVFSSPKGERMEYPAIPVKDIVDPTGAGDAFTAGFFAAYLKTKDFDRAMKVGIRVATENLKHLGACAPLHKVENYY